MVAATKELCGQQIALSTTSDTLHASEYLGSMDAQETDPESNHITIPSNANPGQTYYIGIIADYDNDVPNEYSESNNNDGTPVAVTINQPPRPDLIVSSVTGANYSYYVGDKISATATIKNDGNGSAGSSHLDYYLGTSSNKTYKYIEEGSIGSLNSNENDTDIINWPYWTIPEDVPGGTYCVWVKADSRNEVSEGSNETNNWNRSTYFTITSHKGNLNITVQDQNGSSVNGAEVKRYTNSWEYIDSKTTDPSGVASWTNIDVGGYKLEACYNAEYWVNGSATVDPNLTTNMTLQRNEPYGCDFKVYNANTGGDVTNGTVVTGTPLRYEVKVRNSSPVSRTVRVNFWLDRNQASSYDFYQTSSSQSVSSGGGTKTFIFNFTPTSTGTYFRRFEVETNVNSNYAKTDSWAWGNAFSCTSTSDNAQIVSFTPPTGQKERGDQVTATVRVKNTGTTTRKFWVGLSFAEEWVDVDETPGPWPEGWYDVRPQQTDSLSSQDWEDVQFVFIIPPTSPSGIYTARAAIWNGYDANIHKMSEPRYAKSDLQSFTLDEYSNPAGPLVDQLMDIVTFVKFDELRFGDMAQRYHGSPGGQCEKILLYFKTMADGVISGIPIQAGGSLLIDLADVLRVTPEGNGIAEGEDERWVTAWIDVKGGIAETATGINIDMGLLVCSSGKPA